jgi:hypothetical protein
MPSVSNAAIPSPHVIATYSRRMVRFPPTLQTASAVANASIVTLGGLATKQYLSGNNQINHHSSKIHA